MLCGLFPLDCGHSRNYQIITSDPIGVLHRFRWPRVIVPINGGEWRICCITMHENPVCHESILMPLPVSLCALLLKRLLPVLSEAARGVRSPTQTRLLSVRTRLRMHELMDRTTFGLESATR